MVNLNKGILILLFLTILLAQGVQAAETYAFVTKWGSDGTGDGLGSRLYGIAVDSSSNIYVTDYDNNRILKFSSSGTFLTKWGTTGTGDGQFNSLNGIAVDSSGNVYVVDHLNHRIQKFSSTGTFLTKWGIFGNDDGQFRGPIGVAVDSSGNVYVTDYDNNRIQKFSSTGTFLTKWGTTGNGDGQFSGPLGVAVDSSGNVYISDMNNRIQKFSSSGTFLAKWGSQGQNDGQFQQPDGIAVDSSGNIYVVDMGTYRVQKFSSTGTFVTKWGSLGGVNGQFSGNLIGVAIDSSGNVYVTDSNNLHKFAIQTVTPTPSTPVVTIVPDTVKITTNNNIVVQGKLFSVTITGNPTSEYYLWIEGTSSMTGGYGNEAPMVELYQAGWYGDSPSDLTYPIGSYQYLNGAGKTIRNDVGTDPINKGTRYYCKIKTPTSGVRLLEFTTDTNTKLQDYTFHVEGYIGQPLGQIKSDEVVVRVENGAATNTVPTTSQTTVTTVPTTALTTATTAPIVTTSTTPAPSPTTKGTVKVTVTKVTPWPTDTPTQSTPLGIEIGIIATIGAALLVMNRK